MLYWNTPRPLTMGRQKPRCRISHCCRRRKRLRPLESPNYGVEGNGCDERRTTGRRLSACSCSMYLLIQLVLAEGVDRD